MAEKKHYPPVIVIAGTTVELEAVDGFVEFIGKYDDSVLNFIEATAELRLLEKIKGEGRLVTNVTIESAKRKIERRWEQLPLHIFQAIENRKAEGPVIM